MMSGFINLGQMRLCFFFLPHCYAVMFHMLGLRAAAAFICLHVDLVLLSNPKGPAGSGECEPGRLIRNTCHVQT